MKSKDSTIHFLEHIKELLQEQNIPAVLNVKALDNKIDTLFIPFEGTDLGLTIIYITNESLKSERIQQDVGLVQYHIAFPLSSEKTQMAAISELIHRLNLAIPIPGWIIDRTNSAIHYRYVQLCGSTPPSDELFRYVINIISSYMRTYVPILVDLCHGRIKLEEAINKVNTATAV